MVFIFQALKQTNKLKEILTDKPVQQLRKKVRPHNTKSYNHSQASATSLGDQACPKGSVRLI